MTHSALLRKVPGIDHGFLAPGREPPEGFLRLKQVHGDVVVLAEEELLATQADGLATRGKRAVAVQTADCLPALFADRKGVMVAATHAGWRGLHKGILLRSVETFDEAGIPARDLFVAIGPAIGPCCFEVNREVVDAFERNWGVLWKGASAPWTELQPRNPRATRGPAPASANNLWLDLGAIARLQLESAGVPSGQIELPRACTYCGPGELASYRRATHEGGKAGRQWSWIKR